MAEVTIHLRRAGASTEIFVALSSDEDTLPHEHERLHRCLVASLLGAGVFADRGPDGPVSVDRVRPAREAAGGGCCGGGFIPSGPPDVPGGYDDESIDSFDLY